MLGLLIGLLAMPLDHDFNYDQVVVQEEQITHTGYSRDDERQKMVQKAYDL